MATEITTILIAAYEFASNLGISWRHPTNLPTHSLEGRKAGRKIHTDLFQPPLKRVLQKQKLKATMSLRAIPADSRCEKNVLRRLNRAGTFRIIFRNFQSEVRFGIKKHVGAISVCKLATLLI